MEKNDPLFELIKSLSMSEKRYFKVSSFTKKGEKNYIRLFDAIEKREVYNESEIKKEFEAENFVKQLHVAKNYLHKLILKSMREYYAEQSVYEKVKGNISDIKFLYQKKLFNQCKALAIKNMAIAKEHGFSLLFLETVVWMTQLMYLQISPSKGDKNIDELFDELFNEVENYKNAQQYSFLTLQLAVKNLSEGEVREQEQLGKYEKIINHPLFQSEKKALSSKALFHFYWCLGGYHSFRDDYAKAYYYTQKLVRLFEDRSGFKKVNMAGYISALNNQCVCQRKLKKYKECLATIEKLNEIRVESQKVDKTMLVEKNMLELLVYIELGDFEEGLSLIKKHGYSLGQLKSKTPDNTLRKRDFVYLYNCFIIYFGLENYAGALFYLNEIINNVPLNFRQDIQCNAKIASLIVHYELGNDDLLPYLVKSVYRFLAKKNRVYLQEQIIFDMIRKGVLKVNSEHELIKVFSKTKSRIENSNEKDKSLSDFDLLAWLESKIKKKSFAEIIEQKTKKYRLA